MSRAATADGPVPLADVLPNLTKRFSEWTPADHAAHDERIRRENAESADRNRLMRLDSLGRKLGSRYHPARTGLDRFQTYHPAQTPVLDQLRAITPTVREFVTAGRGLIFYGAVGTGKDFLLASMLYAAVQADVRADWSNGLEVFRTFRDAMDDRRGEPERDIIARLVEPEVLGLSDPLPPVGETSAWRTETLYRVLDARYREGRPTWVTINVKSPAEADAKLTSPVFDRLQHGAELVKCFWPSFRERK